MAFLPVFKVPLAPIGPGPLALVQVAAQVTLGLELQTTVREDFTITEKAPTSAFTFKILLRHYAKQALTPR